MDTARARRHPRWLLVAWWGAAALATVMVVVLATRAASAPAAAEGDDDQRVVPTDVIGFLVQKCVERVPDGGDAFLYETRIAPDGVMTAKLGTPEMIHDDGSITDFIPDVDATSTVNACLAEERVEPRREWRAPTAGERLLVYDWMHRWELPCLAARDLEFVPPPFTAFVGDGDSFPSYVLSQIDPRGGPEVDAVLDARMACAPMPPFLRDNGVGW